MLHLIFIFFLIFLKSTANASDLIDQGFVQSLKAHQRVGLHGMAVFGNEKYFLAHIPMHRMPHDIQLVAEVEIASNQKKSDFSKKTFTVRPLSTFSLNNLAKLQSGEVFTFSGSIHSGSFEMGGPIVPGFENVQFKVTSLKIVRPLPSNIQQKSAVLSDSKSKFEINLIAPSRNFQKIVNLDKKTTLWCVLGPDFFQFCPAQD